MIQTTRLKRDTRIQTIHNIIMINIFIGLHYRQINFTQVFIVKIKKGKYLLYCIKKHTRTQANMHVGTHHSPRWKRNSASLSFLIM